MQIFCLAHRQCQWTLTPDLLFILTTFYLTIVQTNEQDCDNNLSEQLKSTDIINAKESLILESLTPIGESSTLRIPKIDSNVEFNTLGETNSVSASDIGGTQIYSHLENETDVANSMKMTSVDVSLNTIMGKSQSAG